jgi:hypothetical protein
MLPSNKVLLLALNVLGICFVSLQSIILLPDHLTQLRLLRDHVPYLVEVDGEISLLRSLSFVVQMSLDHALCDEILRLMLFIVFISEILNKIFFLSVESLIDPQVCLLLHLKHLFHDFADLPCFDNVTFLDIKFLL